MINILLSFLLSQIIEHHPIVIKNITNQYERITYNASKKIIPAKKVKQSKAKSTTVNNSFKMLDWKKEIADYICTKGWDCKTAVAVAIAESGLNPEAKGYNKNGTVDYGIFQLNKKNITDAKANIDYAYGMYEKRGWQPWVVYNTDRHLQYMNIDYHKQSGSGSILYTGDIN